MFGAPRSSLPTTSPSAWGYRFDEGTRVHTVSGGVGYVDRAWSVELGIRRDVSASRIRPRWPAWRCAISTDAGGADAGPEM